MVHIRRGDGLYKASVGERGGRRVGDLSRRMVDARAASQCQQELNGVFHNEFRGINENQPRFFPLALKCARSLSPGGASCQLLYSLWKGFWHIFVPAGRTSA